MKVFSKFEQLRGFKQTGENQYLACCPAHDDNNPSLSIGIGEDKKILLTCHAGCTAKEVCTALGIEMEELFADAWGKDSGSSPPLSEHKPVAGIPTKEPARSAIDKGTSSKPKIVAKYDYVDKTGTLLYQVVRYQPKGFRQRRPDGKGGWVWNVKEVEKVLYRLPKIIDATDVFIVEGEKDVHTLESMELTATTSVGGAGKFLPEYAQHFNKGQHVVIIPDNDDAGRKHAQQVAKILAGKVASLKILELPDLPQGGDVSDWAKDKERDPLGAGERLSLLADGAPEYAEIVTDTGMWAGHELANLSEGANDMAHSLIPQAAAACTLPFQSDQAEAKVDTAYGRCEPSTGLALVNPSLIEQLHKTNSSDGIHLTDTGNAKIFAMQHGANVRFCKQIGWFAWDERRWVRDDAGAIYLLAKQTVLECYSSLAGVADQNLKDKFYKHLVKSESAKSITSMLMLAQSEPDISIGVGQLDQDQWLFNVLNGTLNLRTEEFHEHRRGDNITRLAPVSYNPRAQCRRFEQFLSEVFEGSPDLIRFVQQYLGYSLTGSTDEQCFVIFYGCGANGKSTLVKTFQRILGDYASQCGIETFLTKHNGGIPNDLARLHSARAVFASESEDGQRLAESLVKQITGGDLISARFLHHEFFEFEPRFKLFLSTNHKPTIRGTDQAIWRRIRLVPFNVAFAPEQQDKALLETLWQERDGIFAWTLRGLKDWQAHGLITPPEVAAATQDYREDQDVIGQFLEECVYETGSSALQCQKLYRIYAWWAKKRGEYVHSERRLQSAITERGIKRGRKESYRTYLDIAVHSEVADEFRLYFEEQESKGSPES